MEKKELMAEMLEMLKSLRVETSVTTDGGDYGSAKFIAVTTRLMMVDQDGNEVLEISKHTQTDLIF